MAFTRHCTGTLELTILDPIYIFQRFPNAISKCCFCERGQHVIFANFYHRIRFGIRWLQNVAYFFPCIFTICSNHNHSERYSDYRFWKKSFVINKTLQNQTLQKLYKTNETSNLSRTRVIEIFCTTANCTVEKGSGTDLQEIFITTCYRYICFLESSCIFVQTTP